MTGLGGFISPGTDCLRIIHTGDPLAGSSVIARSGS